YNEIGAGKWTQKPINYKLMDLGETEDAAKPWVIILCERKIVPKVRRFFAQPERKACFQPHNDDRDEPCLNIAVYDRASQGCGGPDADCNRLEIGGDTLCGQLIRVGTGEAARVCTIGGLVEVKRHSDVPLLYGLTTAHGIFLHMEEEPGK